MQRASRNKHLNPEQPFDFEVVVSNEMKSNFVLQLNEKAIKHV